MNYDVLLNRTGFNKLSITPQHFRSVSEGDSRHREHDVPQAVADRSGDGTKTPGRKISLPPHAAHRHETVSASCSPMRGGTSSIQSVGGPGEEFKGKVESKLLTMWNNMKFGWSYKMKTNFNKEQPLWLLGRCYHQKVTPGPSMESSVELATSGPDGQLMVLQNVYLAEGSNSPPEETGTDAIEDSSPEAIVEEEGIDAFRRDFISRIWMTYRREFQTMDDSNYTSDCGWGCMIRSGQMLLAQGLVAHFLGRSWRWDVSMFTAYEESIHRKVIRWFGDTSSKTSPFSIHTLVALGKESGKKPGDWYGPGAVAHLLRQAVRLAAQEITDLDGINVYVAQDCAVYIQDILDECTISAAPPAAPWQQKSVGNSRSSTKKVNVDKGGASPAAEGDDELQSTHWKSLILLVPLRLGTDKLNPIYNECLKAMLSLDYCIGIIGGRPKHSLYFVGYQEDKLIHLDPHYCQDMVDVNQEHFPVASFHCKSPRKMKLSKMDPSCCIGFYCETKRDFYKFIDSVKPFLIPVHQGSQETGFANPSGSSTTSSVSYPMFVFCRGKSSEQRADLPGQHSAHYPHPTAYRSPPTAIPQQSGATNDEDDDEEEDEAIEFVIL
ncbi:cysteine protease ATG4C [Anopheles stephensi]|uniref:cysteine protease ATG4C n=1 Tax=Anopheles stephensi TaxID=30069 RepID=UPI00165878B0|nr:cysteine protease ATG4C [Anopheles stephensi]